jgi:hypothetical protein
MDELKKKDDDIKIVDESLFGITVETSEVDNKETTIEVEKKFMSVTVRIVRHLFLVNAGIWFYIGMFGIVPTHLLMEKTSFVTTLIVFLVALGFMVLFNVIMYHFRRMIYCFVVSLFVVFFSLSALLKSIGPFQASLILFTESVIMLVYCSNAQKRIDPYISFLMMVGIGICTWGIGFIGFIREQDWITSAILFFTCVLGFPLYSAFQIDYATRKYHLKELTQAIVGFFTGWSFLVAKCAKKAHPEEDQSFVLVEKESSAETEGVVNEVTI